MKRAQSLVFPFFLKMAQNLFLLVSVPLYVSTVFAIPDTPESRSFYSTQYFCPFVDTHIKLQEFEAGWTGEFQLCSDANYVSTMAGGFTTTTMSSFINLNRGTGAVTKVSFEALYSGGDTTGWWLREYTFLNVRHVVDHPPFQLPNPPVLNKPPFDLNVVGQHLLALPEKATLVGHADDDGLPNPPGRLTYRWAYHGPSEKVVFSSPSAQITDVSFQSPGLYTIQLMVFDGETMTAGTKSLKVVSSNSTLDPTSEKESSKDNQVQGFGSTMRTLFRLSRDESFPIPVVVREPLHVKLKIFNSAGDEVALIAHEDIATPKTFYWNGRNNQGQHVSLGIYLLVLNLDNAAIRKKIAVVK